MRCCIVLRVHALSILVAGVLLFTIAPALRSQTAQPPTGDARVCALLEPLRQKHQLPALAAAIVTSNRIITLGAVGVRKLGANVPVTINDQFHLGSDTKAMTSTLVGLLVEKGKLRWDTRVAQSFPELADSMPQPLRNATLLHLLSHRAGLPANLPWHLIPRDLPIREQRQAGLKMLATVKLESEPGAKYNYSNIGYFIVGCMIEKATDSSWEDAMTKMIFEPLGMKSAGFGGVGTPGMIDQPWPHTADGKPTPINGPLADNHPALGPAGTVHCTMNDWAKFIADQLRGVRGGKALLQQATYRQLYTVHFGGDYALGWIRTKRDWGGGDVLTHGGDNTMNHCVAWMAPLKDFAVLIATNRGGDGGDKACDEASAAIIGLYLSGR